MQRPQPTGSTPQHAQAFTFRNFDQAIMNTNDANDAPDVDYAVEYSTINIPRATERNAEAGRLLEEQARHGEERVVACERELDARERALNAQEYLIDREREGAEPAAEAAAAAAESKTTDAKTDGKMEKLMMID
ncbi:hypothetical protein BBJ28_00011559 [Nothophytophthora sp. Chile5]|nr:hypothetical protein BBJ28_00011559 [Nothophytophthora sp. Chile5]